MVAASVWDMLASVVSTMVRLSRVAMVVHVAYMATPFCTCRRDRKDVQAETHAGYILPQKMLNMNLRLSFPTDQHTVEPQVYSVVFVEPGSIAVETVAGEEYHNVVSRRDQDEESQCSRHQPLIGMKNIRESILVLVLSRNMCVCFLIFPMKSGPFLHTFTTKPYCTHEQNPLVCQCHRLNHPLEPTRLKPIVSWRQFLKPMA